MAWTSLSRLVGAASAIGWRALGIRKSNTTNESKIGKAELVILGDLDQNKVFVPGRRPNEAGSLVLAAATYVS